MVVQVELIDEFVHPKTGRGSKCFRVNYRSMERSLTNEEVDVLQVQPHVYTPHTYMWIYNVGGAHMLKTWLPHSAPRRSCRPFWAIESPQEGKGACCVRPCLAHS